MRKTGFSLGPAESDAPEGHPEGDVQWAVGSKVWCSGEWS